MVGHTGSLFRRTAPLIFRGQIGALEKAAKTSFHLEDFYNSSKKSQCFHGISSLFFYSLSMFLPGSHSVRLHFTFSVFSFGINRHLTFASVSPRYEDLDNFGSIGANAACSFHAQSIHGKSI